jgi:hypothetical protein
VWNSLEIANIQTSTINQADNYFGYPATIKHGRESLFTRVWALVCRENARGLLPQAGINCVEIYVSKEN